MRNGLAIVFLLHFGNFFSKFRLMVTFTAQDFQKIASPFRIDFSERNIFPQQQ